MKTKKNKNKDKGYNVPSVPKDITQKTLLNPFNPVRLALLKIRKHYLKELKKLDEVGLTYDENKDNENESKRLRYQNEVNRINALLESEKEVSE